VTRALRVVKALRAGITWVNTYHPTYSEAPWGGYKQSGVGRELGTFGLEEYQEVKQINIDLTDRPMGVFLHDTEASPEGTVVSPNERRVFSHDDLRDEKWVGFCRNCR
jgi:hypothetical protein